jgi:excisionase family DNA binding protein
MGVTELAETLDVPTSWIYARTRETGPGAMLRIRVGKYVRFRIDDVMAWLKKENDNNCQIIERRYYG